MSKKPDENPCRRDGRGHERKNWKTGAVRRWQRLRQRGELRTGCTEEEVRGREVEELIV